MKRIPPNNNDGFLTKTEIEKFKKIALKDYGVKLTSKEAFGQGIALVSFFEYLIKRRLENQP